jgi:S-adenosylmethionine hydrolase
LTASRRHDPIVTLTTDFGLRDPFVASMKAVILSIEKRARLVDLSHEMPPHRVLPAAWFLREACPWFPAGTIHVAVVDPGVGGPRRPLVAKAGGQLYVGPDNGIFSLVFQKAPLEGAWQISDPKYLLPKISRTFHGRDLFAPAAAHLARGLPPSVFGPEILDPTTLEIPGPTVCPDRLAGEVVWVDRFGNCATNLEEAQVSRWAAGEPFTIHAASRKIRGVSESYASVPAGRLLAIFNSSGLLEIACNQASAHEALGLKEGDPVVLERVRNPRSKGKS